jgi:GDPmannose 4,6-dehydratase
LCDLAFIVNLNYQDYIVQTSFYRPAEVDHLVANPSKANQELKWEPKVDFEGLVHMMVDADLKRQAQEIA